MVATHRLEQLAQPRTARYRMYAQRKEQLEQERELSQCTFRPKVNNSSRAARPPVVQRLYDTGDTKAASREQQRLQHRAAETDGCTFTPQLVSVSRQRNRVPLQERAAQERVARAAKLAQLQVCGRSDGVLCITHA